MHRDRRLEETPDIREGFQVDGELLTPDYCRIIVLELVRVPPHTKLRS